MTIDPTFLSTAIIKLDIGEIRNKGFAPVCCGVFPLIHVVYVLHTYAVYPHKVLLSLCPVEVGML